MLNPDEFKARVYEVGKSTRKRGKTTAWQCAECGHKEPEADAHQRRKLYCSYACMGAAYKKRQAGKANTNFRFETNSTCKICGKAFKRYGGGGTYCAWPCKRIGDLAAGKAQQKMGYAKRVDENQSEIVKALEAAGAVVGVLSNLGGGVPDLLVGVKTRFDGTKGELHLVEVKNPKSKYGRAGLNKLQKAFAAWWPCPVHLVYTVDEALEAVGLKKKSNDKA